MSPMDASGSSSSMMASWYAFTIQTDADGFVFKSRPIVGSATLTIVWSITVMKIARQTVTMAQRRCCGGRPSWTMAECDFSTPASVLARPAEKAGGRAGVACRAGLVHLQQQRVTIAIDPCFDKPLRVP